MKIIKRKNKQTHKKNSKEDKKMNNQEIFLYDRAAPKLINERYDASVPTAAVQFEKRPNIDDVICYYVDGENLKEALFVIDNIRENKMKIKWFSANVWTVRYKRRYVCDLRIENDSLIIGEISGVLATRVRSSSHSPEHIERFINALRESITVKQSAYAVN